MQSIEGLLFFCLVPCALCLYRLMCKLCSIFKDFMIHNTHHDIRNTNHDIRNTNHDIRNTHHDIRNTNHIRCDNCFFSIWMMGANRPMLGCKQRASHIGRWRIVQLEQSCPNFYPSSTFKAGSEATRRIPLTCGQFALVDAEDYYRLAKFQWFANGPTKTKFYAVRKCDRKNVKMHRVIMAAPDHLSVDHIDRNGLNNCKSNLRLCTHAQNSCNKPSRNGVSKYKGINRDRYEKKWTARVHFNNKTCHIGTFATEIDAAKAYDKKAVELHGEFACLNFPPNPKKPEAQAPG